MSASAENRELGRADWAPGDAHAVGVLKLCTSEAAVETVEQNGSFFATTLQ